MANSRFEYVREFERYREGSLMPNTWIVVRVDGNGFSDFVKKHGFKKPMDQRGVDLMEECAALLCHKFRDVRLAFGQSDEYSFVLPKSCQLWKRREAKILSSFASYFASCFVFLWTRYFPNVALLEPPTFDSRCVCFPSDLNLRDYLSWRQADTHINHLLNSCFWALVQHQNKSPKEAQMAINGTSSAEKHEILFQSGINYNNEPAQWRKGTTLYWSAKTATEKSALARAYVDIIGEEFWKENGFLLRN